MNRAEKRRQKNLAKKAARKAKPGKAASRPPGQQTPAIQQSLESAVRHHTQGRLPEAESIYQQILQADPNQPVALHLLGVIAHQVGKHNTAVDLITKALAIKPDFAEAHNNLGNTFNELGRLDEAMASFHNALAIKPDYVDAHNNLGNTFQELGRLDEAMASYLKALSLKPDYPEAHNNLGSAFNELGRLDEATTSYLKALSLKPDYDEAHNNLGIALHNQGKLEEAVASYDKALAIKPDFAEAHNNLGKAFKDLGRLDEAVASYDKALAIKPDFAEAHNNLGSVFNELGQLDEALQCLAKAVECKPGLTEAHSNFLATRNYVPDGSSTEMFAEARRYGEIIAARAEPLRQHSNVPNVNRRLRVGMVSGDLRRHPVGHHLDNVLSTLDRDSLAIFLYSTSVKEDDLTARLKSNVAQWRNVAGVGDDQLYETIIADEIDILVDLAGHTARNRLPVFSRKPAPVQVTWLGYIATTGVVAIDYILCDRWVLPPEDESYFVETPWRLPGSYICFTPPNLEIGVGVLPAQRDGRVTFGSFNPTFPK